MPIIDYIPESYKEGFSFLASLTDQDFSTLIDSLANIQKKPTFKGLTLEIIKVAPELDKDAIEDILLSVGSLISVLEDEKDIDQLVIDITALCIEEDIIESENSKNFRHRLKKIISNKQVFYTSKARELISETGNLFLNCRIVTDIRPIFDYDLTKQPDDSLIIHNLHIHYQADIAAPHQDIYLSLDAEDIKKLRDVLNRAEKKEENLKKMLSKK